MVLGELEWLSRIHQPLSFFSTWFCYLDCFWEKQCTPWVIISFRHDIGNEKVRLYEYEYEYDDDDDDDDDDMYIYIYDASVKIPHLNTNIYQ